MSIAEFYTALREVEYNERAKKEAKKNLKHWYEILVSLCPHSEAVEHRFQSTGGLWRVCKICGVEDFESVGGSPGDEYNYGTHGHPDPKFWADADVEVTKDEKYFWTFRKGHNYRVVGGKVKNSLA